MSLLNIRGMNSDEKDLRERVLEEVKKTPIVKPAEREDVYFYIVDMEAMSFLVSTGGFLHRYAHWSFGKEFNKWKKMVDRGMVTFYELVINTEPPIAYILDINTDIQKMTVMAHVDAHVDFFRNNFLYKETPEKMHKIMSEHDAWFTHYKERYGYERVGHFIDLCISISNLIDPQSVRINRDDIKKDRLRDEEKLDEPKKLPTSSYMDEFINPEEILNIQKERIKKEYELLKKTPQSHKQDVLKYILENSDKLENWQKKILGMIRDEAYFFVPVQQTTIMNEGWARFWHLQIMSSPRLNDGNIVPFADMDSGIGQRRKQGVNPYDLGFKLWKYIQDKGDKGRFCDEYEMEEKLEKKKKFDKGTMDGMNLILKAREKYSDMTFIMKFLDQEFMEEEKYFVEELDPQDNWFKIRSRSADEFKEELLPSLTNRGEPSILLVDGDYGNRKELLLVHVYDGHRLDKFMREETTKILCELYQRPVHLLTKERENVLIISSEDKGSVTEKKVNDVGLIRFFK